MVFIMVRFRSWCEEENKFYYWQDGEYNFCGGYTEMNHRNRFNWQNAEQFTRKIDINAKEIFEGDIVRNAKGETSIVRLHSILNSFTVLFQSDGIDKVIGLFDELEIIGNIHENKELLNELQ